jgi:uncharacterized protein
MRSKTSRISRSPKKTSTMYMARSVINGRGVFARKFLPANTAVIACKGLVLRAREVRTDMRAMQIGADVYLAEDPDNPGIDDFINHSCEPNVGFQDGCLTLYALRDITVDEEIVFDYSTCMNEAGWSLRCRCRASSCRGLIISFDELSSRDRKRLGVIALAYLRERGNPRGGNARSPAGRKTGAAQGRARSNHEARSGPSRRRVPNNL